MCYSVNKKRHLKAMDNDKNGIVKFTMTLKNRFYVTGDQKIVKWF